MFNLYEHQLEDYSKILRAASQSNFLCKALRSFSPCYSGMMSWTGESVRGAYCPLAVIAGPSISLRPGKISQILGKKIRTSSQKHRVSTVIVTHKHHVYGTDLNMSPQQYD